MDDFRFKKLGDIANEPRWWQTADLRFVHIDGKKILQQRWNLQSHGKDVEAIQWRNVPFVDLPGEARP